MHKKYFFFDVDGTLATGLTTIMPESGVRCLQKLRENGHFTALATGRLQVSAADVAARYGFRDFVSDGGYSLTMDGKLLEMRPLPAEDCIALLDRMNAQGIPWAVTDENRLICRTPDERYVPFMPDNYYFSLKVEPEMDYRAIRTFYKVYLACPPEREGEIDLGGLPHVRYNRDVIFIEPTSKQRGIRRVQELLGIPDEDIVVFGDGTNDVCMFGQGWLSIAMGNGRAVLKEKADYVTTAVDDDGLWNACKHFGWI